MPDWRDEVRRYFAERGLPEIRDDARLRELAEHLEDRYDDLRAEEVPPAQARAGALRELDDLDGSGRLTRDLARPPAPIPQSAPLAPSSSERAWIAGLGSDLRQAFRSLVRTPGFAIAAIATVALTTGPTTAALGIANWLFLAPVPGVSQSARLLSVDFGTPNEGGGYRVASPSYAHVEALLRAAPSVTGMAGYSPESVSLATATHTPEVVEAELVSASYFDVLGVRLVEGRTFLREEDRHAGGEPVVVLSEPVANRLFPEGGSVGSPVRVNDQAFTVVGVAAGEFFGSARVGRTALWLPGLTSRRVRRQPVERWAFAADDGPFYRYVGRLAPDASTDRATAELTQAAVALATIDPTASKFETVRPMVSAGFAQTASRLEDAVMPLLAISVLLVLLGTANLANQFGFRALRAAHDTVVRRALGAGTARLVRPRALEALLIAIAGGLAGLLLAMALRSAMGSLLTGRDAVEVPVDWRLGLAALGLSIGVGLLLSVVPAHVAARTGLSGALGRRNRTATGSGSRLRTGIAAAQLALSMTLLIGALLFIATLKNIRSLETGFNPDRLMTVSFGFRQQGYDAARIEDFFARVARALDGRPTIERVAIGSGIPQFGGEIHFPIRLPGGAEPESIPVSGGSTGYFAALELPMVAGREWTSAEANSPTPPIVISESLARQVFSDARSAVGERIGFTRSALIPEYDAVIVGVTRDVRPGNLRQSPEPAIYRPTYFYSQSNQWLIVRGTGSHEDAIQQVRQAAGAIDPRLPVMPTLMEDRLDSRVGTERLMAWTMGVLATLGFLVASVGLHGLMSQAVVQRRREFGVRLAVGASRGHVIWLVLRSALTVVLAGVGAGIVMALTGTAWIRSLLFGIAPVDPGTYIVATGTLAAVVLVTALIPAITASRQDPVEVLRFE